MKMEFLENSIHVFAVLPRKTLSYNRLFLNAHEFQFESAVNSRYFSFQIFEGLQGFVYSEGEYIKLEKYLLWKMFPIERLNWMIYIQWFEWGIFISNKWIRYHGTILLPINVQVPNWTKILDFAIIYFLVFFNSVLLHTICLMKVKICNINSKRIDE